MDNKRFCNDVNPFSAEHAERNSAHAFQLRGKYIFQSVPRKRNVGHGPAGIRWIIGISTAVAFFGFLTFQVWRVVAPPQLTISSPIEGEYTTTAQVVVAGNTAPEVAVEINGQTVFSRPDGSFAQPVELQYGPNHIFIRATKKHGLFTTVSRTIMLKSPEGVASPVSLSPVTAPAHSLN